MMTHPGPVPVTGWGAKYWPVFLVSAAIMFLAPECWGLATDHANTLSDFARWQLGDYRGEPFWQHDWQWFASQVAYLILTGWLWGHIWYAIWG